MGELVSYRLDGSVATITMDDGKVNVLSSQMLAEIGAALDRAEADRAAVVLAGRQGVFSAGFDLAALRAGGAAGPDMVTSGFELAERILSFPLPVVIACTGHAVAMGLFLLLSADYRIGAAGAYKITANEVAIGLTMPDAAIEICRQRIGPAYLTRTVVLAEVFAPEAAAAGGLLDLTVPAAELASAAQAVAARLAGLDLAAHAAAKLAVRRQTLTALRAAIESDAARRSAA
jgi:enoyl-CoA hydratase